MGFSGLDRRLSEGPASSFVTRLAGVPSVEPVAAGSSRLDGAPRSCDPQVTRPLAAHQQRSSTNGRTSGEAPGPRARHGRDLPSALRRRSPGLEAKGWAPTAPQIPGQQGPGVAIGRRQVTATANPDLGPSLSQSSPPRRANWLRGSWRRGWLPEGCPAKTRHRRIWPRVLDLAAERVASFTPRHRYLVQGS